MLELAEGKGGIHGVRGKERTNATMSLLGIGRHEGEERVLRKEQSPLSSFGNEPTKEKIRKIGRK